MNTKLNFYRNVVKILACLDLVIVIVHSMIASLFVLQTIKLTKELENGDLTQDEKNSFIDFKTKGLNFYLAVSWTISTFFVAIVLMHFIYSIKLMVAGTKGVTPKIVAKNATSWLKFNLFLATIFVLIILDTHGSVRLIILELIFRLMTICLVFDYKRIMSKSAQNALPVHFTEDDIVEEETQV